MLKLLISLISGFLFALGLGVSGMTQPQKVIGFLDVFGEWNPALAFVMIGAISVHALFNFILRKKTSPVFDTKFYLPEKKQIDWKLILGSSVFGVGWGLGGFCPGPAITSLFSGSYQVIIFMIAMVIGILLFNITKKNGIIK